ncbi:MAG: hypothetical protein LQ337_002278 [Flavoplaca oasis]|nr:MAG: hypothetical protein LQ337_002278 [Flavoplaca oasis]
MNREAPISSITAGPSRASIIQDDDSLPTSTSSNTIAFTLSRTVKSSISSTSLSLSSPNPEVSSPPPTTEPPEEPASRTNLEAGLGGGLGGAVALLTSIAIFLCWRRRQKQAKASETPYHEMDAHDSTYRHNSMLFPAELNEEDSKKSMEPAELPAKLPSGPYELQGDIAPIAHGHAPPTSGKNATIRLHEKTESGDTTLISEKPGSDATTPASPSGDPKKAEMGVKRPAALNRPDSTHSQGGPWHDRF